MQRALPIVLTLSLMSPSVAAPITQCKAGETVVFSCSTGSRFLSICASGDFGKERGVMQYRYGLKDKPELVFPETPQAPRKLFKPGTMACSGGGGAYLQFAKATHTYTVFSAMGNWGKSGKGTAEGVAVESQGKPVANIPCRKDVNFVPGELGPEFFEQAKLGEPVTDFEIPDVFMPK